MKLSFFDTAVLKRYKERSGGKGHTLLNKKKKNLSEHLFFVGCKKTFMKSLIAAMSES